MRKIRALVFSALVMIPAAASSGNHNTTMPAPPHCCKTPPLGKSDSFLTISVSIFAMMR